MSKVDEVRAVLGSSTNDKSVLAEALWQSLASADSLDDRKELLAIILVERDSVPKNPKSLPNIGLSKERWDELSRTHKEVISGHLRLSFFRTHNAVEFANDVLRLIDFQLSEEEKVFVLAVTLYSAFVPYRELPGTPVHMTGQEFTHKLYSDTVRRDLVNYIVDLPFEETTEMASMLLQVVDDTTDKDLRVALLACGLGAIIHRASSGHITIGT